MIIDIKNVASFKDLRKMIPQTIMEVVGSKGIMIMSSDDVEFRGLPRGKVVGYMGADRPNTYVSTTRAVPEFIGKIGDDDKTLFK